MKKIIAVSILSLMLLGVGVAVYFYFERPKYMKDYEPNFDQTILNDGKILHSSNSMDGAWHYFKVSYGKGIFFCGIAYNEVDCLIQK
jgi:hypothetical protein